MMSGPATSKRVMVPAYQRGFNLIEVMVAVLVTALGLAGIAGLLLGGMTTSHTAALNSVAVAHAQTGVDMMRANLEAYVDGWYDGSNTRGNPSGTAGGCAGSACDVTTEAANDYASWRQLIATSLPGGIGIICMDSTPDDGQPGADGCEEGGNFNVIKIFWLDSRDERSLAADGETFHRYVVTVNP